MKNKLLIPIVALMLTGALTTGAVVVQAQSNDSTPDPMTSLVQKIATKFNLNQADVQAVFNEHKTEMKANMQARHEEKLSQLVTDGKITETQKQAILNKVKELHAQKEANMEAMKNMTPEQRKEVMEKHKAELEQWAKDNNIDPQYLRFGLKFHHKGMMLKQ